MDEYFLTLAKARATELHQEAARARLALLATRDRPSALHRTLGGLSAWRGRSGRPVAPAVPAPTPCCA